MSAVHKSGGLAGGGPTGRDELGHAAKAPQPVVIMEMGTASPEDTARPENREVRRTGGST
ncbi:MAG: hypothetical protein QOJ30_2453 [Pseudonocardiales bacterium]|jgi:hypothetical protein|nr:hypothetical protein [Pseudonocardiales bacterium]